VTDDAAGAGEDQMLDLRVVAGKPTAEELAAALAVLHAAVAEQAANPEPPVVPEGNHWQRANGFLRGPLVPGPGAWRSF
jgi:Acyl-CoA carboxylase epsilon subunit